MKNEYIQNEETHERVRIITIEFFESKKTQDNDERIQRKDTKN